MKFTINWLKEHLDTKYNEEKIIDNDKVEVSISENVNVEIVRATGIQGLINKTDQKK